MGSRLSKDINDAIRYSKGFLKDYILDKYGPVKYDAFEQLLTTYLTVLPEVAERIDAIEQHLEKGIQEGRSFIRSEERPDVGAGAYENLPQALELINKRLDQIESGQAARAASKSTGA